MSKKLIINKFYEIRFGIAHGFTGKLIAYDSLDNKASIQVEENLTISTNSENLILIED